MLANEGQLEGRPERVAGSPITLVHRLAEHVQVLLLDFGQDMLHGGSSGDLSHRAKNSDLLVDDKVLRLSLCFARRFSV